MYTGLQIRRNEPLGRRASRLFPLCRSASSMEMPDKQAYQAETRLINAMPLFLDVSHILEPCRGKKKSTAGEETREKILSRVKQ